MKDHSPLYKDGNPQTFEGTVNYDQLDPRTPVIIGAGQSSERISTSEYKAMSPIDLAETAAKAAILDCGIKSDRLFKAIDTVAATRQFENSSPRASAPLGRSNNFVASVAKRLGITPKRAILEVTGGQSPQSLVSDLCQKIYDGTSDIALAFGSEAISTTRHYKDLPDRPDFSDHADCDLEDRGYGLNGIVSLHQSSHGLTNAPSQYALFENARRIRMHKSRPDYAIEMGTLFEPFTKIAAQNSHSSAPKVRSARELTTPSDSNRMICEPYTRYLIARDQVNQGAALVITSIQTALQLGVPIDKMVFLHGRCDVAERPLIERDDLSKSPAAVLASKAALEMAGIGVDRVNFFDLYSCFPIAVFNICDGLGIQRDDPRDLTISGGLPFFGGPGNDYSMHAIIQATERLRQHPGSYAFIGANGGMLSKYSVGIYSNSPCPWRADNMSSRIQQEVNQWPSPGFTFSPEGKATIETYTIKYSKSGKFAIVVGRLISNNKRFFARTQDGDEATLQALEKDDLATFQIEVKSYGFGNRFSLDKATQAIKDEADYLEIKEPYEFIKVQRYGHSLEITIDRQSEYNALNTKAHCELDSIFDNFFNDSQLWVAILAGAGDVAFSSGNDFGMTIFGRDVWIPKNGLAGLSQRKVINKPVIAAVNRLAMGAGFEIALACHMIVADDNAQFGFNESRTGLVPGAFGMTKIERTISPQLANELILTAKRLSASEAFNLGIVNQITESGKALDGARELAKKVIAASPTSIRLSLEILEKSRENGSRLDLVKHQAQALDQLIASDDLQEGLASLLENRPPMWKNH
ncbi:enoyl-CoA hydratase-related protein [Acidithrix sp. C25]|uniref:enoyl-CoA hydratase-related protein n=1 Tax=Acidithrix sp. C25 TaxID=1671482 RepID=UPI00191BA1F5|nr:enoyl-CoA hydratase-related protein [Acidithrix sp. C25]CAG4899734.1 unnamed protein product [Acidithrix sp. C25]